MAIALVGAAYPAYRCARLPIAETLRGLADYYSLMLRRNFRTISCATIGSFDRNRFAP